MGSTHANKVNGVVLGGLDGMKTFIIHHQWGINQHEGQLALGVCV
jgi:hypothetical protein